MMGRPATIRGTILKAMADCTDPLGVSTAWLIANAGVDPQCLKATMHRMAAGGLIFAVKKYKRSRYFLTVEARDAAMAGVLELHAVAVAEALRHAKEIAKRRVRKHRDRRGERRVIAQKKAREAKPPKPQKPPKLVQPKPVNRDTEARKKWADQVALEPPGLKVQKLEGFPLRSRFEPPQNFKGEFSKDWDAKRSA